MPRTATKVKTAIADNNGIVQPKPGTGPAAHHMVRSLAATETGNAQTFDQLNAELERWLSAGYKVAHADITYIRTEESPGGFTIDQPRWDILYLLIRE